MKSFAATLILALALSEALAEGNMKNVMDKCKEEAKATEDPVDFLERGTVPLTREGKCMLACLYEETGIVKDGKLDLVKVDSLLREDYGDLPDLEGKVSMFMEKCVKPTQEMDKCEAVAFVHSCVVEIPDVSLKSLKAMLTPKPQKKHQ